jgi:polar amino acid transport system permease protein
MNLADFLIVWEQYPTIWSGFLNTVTLLLLAGSASLAIGVVLTPLLMSEKLVIQRIVAGYCECMRCVPFLMFVYLIYFGLPSFGIQLSNWVTGFVALIIYNSAYMTIILQAAWKDIPEETVEAGKAFGFNGIKLLRRIIMPLILMRATPMIGNQMTQILKDSAFLGIIAVSELTAVMNAIQATHFIPFASFLSAVLLYWSICLVIEFFTLIFTRYAEERRA